MINDENWYEYPYRKLFGKYRLLYNEEYQRLQEEYVKYNLDYGRPIVELYDLALEAEQACVSRVLFPGDIVYFYPMVMVNKARKVHTCAISGAIIMPGSEYMVYKCFLYNKTKRLSYVTSGISMEIGADFYLPLSLEDFELFYERVQNSYEERLEVEYNIKTSLSSPLVRSLRKNK